MLAAMGAGAAALLAVSGLAKLVSPAPAAAMVSTVLSLGRRRGRTVAALVRAGALAEAVIGVVAIAVGGRLAAALLAVCYLVFTVVALRLALTRQSPSCGCFGRADSPVGVPHVVLDLVCLGVAIACVTHPAPGGAGLFDDGAAVAAIGCAQVALLACLGYLCITALPALGAARRLEEVR